MFFVGILELFVGQLVILCVVDFGFLLRYFVVLFAVFVVVHCVWFACLLLRLFWDFVDLFLPLHFLVFVGYATFLNTWLLCFIDCFRLMFRCIVVCVVLFAVIWLVVGFTFCCGLFSLVVGWFCFWVLLFSWVLWVRLDSGL